MTIDRQTLYEQVWTTPMSRLSRTYGMSDVGLAKICKQHLIPRPPREYWVKKRNGKSVRRQHLPTVSDPRLEKVYLDPRPVAEVESEPREVDRRVASERATGEPIIVGDRLEEPHPLVLRTMTSLRAARADEKGMVRPRAKGCLDVVIGPESIDRAMMILDSLIRGLESRSFRVSVKDGEPASTLVEVDGELIPFRLDERAARKERPRDERKSERLYSFFRPKIEYDYFPSGELAIHLSVPVPMMSRHSWRDGGKKRVEDWLNSFVVGLIRTSQGLKEERAETERRRVAAERRRQEWEDSEQRRREAERLRKEEEERVRQVEATLDAWIRYRSLAEMIAEVHSRAADLGREVPLESRLGQWLLVAERRLQSLDPIRPMLAEIQPAQADTSTLEECRPKDSRDAAHPNPIPTS